MQSFATPGKTRIIIVNPIGDLDLSTDGADTTSVELIERSSDGESLASETSVSSEESNGVFVVTVTLPSQRSFSRRRSGLDIRISAPIDADVVVSTSSSERSLLSIARGPSGDIRLRGPVGDVDISIPSGDFTAQVVNGSLSVKTASGDLSADKVNGPIKIRSVSGDVFIDEANAEASLALVSGDATITTANAPVDVTSISGDVTVTDANAGASCKSTSGDVMVRRAWSGTVRANTVSGDVLIGVPPGRGVSVDARSMSGDLLSEIELSDNLGAAGGESNVVRITANSISGDVMIRRALPATA